MPRTRALRQAHMRLLTNLVDWVEVGNDVETDLGTLVLQLSEEQWQQVFNGTKHNTHNKHHNSAPRNVIKSLTGVTTVSSEQSLNGTSAQLHYTVPFTSNVKVQE